MGLTAFEATIIGKEVADNVIGKCECLNPYIKELLYDKLFNEREELGQVALKAKQGIGDSPFALCMRSIAGRGGSAQERQQHFTEAARQCARESHDPRDMVPRYKEHDHVLLKYIDDLKAIRPCSVEGVY